MIRTENAQKVLYVIFDYKSPNNRNTRVLNENGKK